MRIAYLINTDSGFKHKYGIESELYMISKIVFDHEFDI